jgi:hypothetical protein
MKHLSAIFVFCLLCATGAWAQVDSSRAMVKYTQDFKFQDGIFMNFDEFKNNAPSITQFEVVKDKNSGDGTYIYLKYSVQDTSGSKKKMTNKTCFGFSKNGVLYFSDGNNGFYRMFIVGALSHFIQYQPIYGSMDNFYGNTTGLNFSGNELREYLLDFQTGETFVFVYRNFRDFLKSHDEELLKELEKTKNKRDMIHHFLLKYNERHPVYFPAK